MFGVLTLSIGEQSGSPDRVNLVLGSRSSHPPDSLPWRTAVIHLLVGALVTIFPTRPLETSPMAWRHIHTGR